MPARACPTNCNRGTNAAGIISHCCCMPETSGIYQPSHLPTKHEAPLHPGTPNLSHPPSLRLNQPLLERHPYTSPQSTPGVVYINTFVSQRDAFSMNVLEVPAGTGSGFVWDDQGHVVTNFHVIRCGSPGSFGSVSLTWVSVAARRCVA